MERLVRQAELCRRTFAGACDVFLHTWSRLDKAPDFGSRAQFGSRCHGLCLGAHRHNHGSILILLVLRLRIDRRSHARQQAATF